MSIKKSSTNCVNWLNYIVPHDLTYAYLELVEDGKSQF